MIIVLTGATGFVGSHLVPLLQAKGHDMRFIGRDAGHLARQFPNEPVASYEAMVPVLQGADLVVHVAARAHVMNDKVKSPLDEYRKVNTFGTLDLARQAAIAGVKRFIFVSSIKVLGEKTEPGCAFKSGDSYNPQDPYSISKMEAEAGLKLIGEVHGMEIVIIRPPLVYGQGAKGNFRSLLKITRLGVPLPLGSIHNKRSLVSVQNLADLIMSCLSHENAKNQIFLVSDDDDMSTSALFSRLAEAGGYRAYIFSFPLILLSIFFRVLGRSTIYERLSGSMQVNIDHTKSQLGWKPPFKTKESLRSCWLPNTEG